MNIALIGPSGVGKGTHAGTLVTRFDFLHLVTGDLFREKLEQRRALGILAKKYMARGELVPDEMVDAMVEEWLWDSPRDKSVLFDGFPRTVYQAKFLDALLEELDQALDAVIYLRALDEVIMQRLSGRITCRQCQTPYHLEYQPPAKDNICDRCGGQLYQRPDDIREIARVRLRTFHRVTDPLLRYYQETDRLVVVDGTGSIETVGRAIVGVVEAVQQGQVIPEEVIAAETVEAILTPVAPIRKKPREGFNIVLVGGPGSGKGTQAEYLTQELNVAHISTGDIFRENVRNKTDLGRLAKSYMDRGELVPDDVTEAMVEERLSRPDTERGFILDGFPRTLAQAEALSQIMSDLERPLDGVLYIKVSDAEIIARLSGRLICNECQNSFHKIYHPFRSCPYNKCQGEYLYQRDDDKPDTVRNRLETFHRQTSPLINYYKEAKLLVEIEGEGDVVEVRRRSLDAVLNLANTR